MNLSNFFQVIHLSLGFLVIHVSSRFFIRIFRGDIASDEANELGLFRGAIVPYIIHHMTGNAEGYIAVLKAINSIEMQTCIRFVAPSNSLSIPNTTLVIDFTHSKNESRFIGMEKFMVLVHHNDDIVAIKARLLNVIAGLHLEHQREDRDTYVRINWDNIQKGSEWEFRKRPGYPPNLPFFSKYAFESIMTAGKYYRSKNGKPTIEPLPGRLGNVHPDESIDMKRVNAVYSQLVRREPFLGILSAWRGPTHCSLSLKNKSDILDTALYERYNKP